VRWIFAIGALVQFIGMLLMRRVPAPAEMDADSRGPASMA
jgi:hypothetical protein